MEQEKEDKLDFVTRPAIYSQNAVLWFAILMTPLFGGVLLMMNLKTINKRKEAGIVFIVSLLMTLGIYILSLFFDSSGSIITISMNVLCAFILTEAFFKKQIPDAAEYPNRSNLWPVLIAVAILVIFIALVMLAFWAQDQVV